MVFLNGNFTPKEKAFISVMDRAFLFGDGIYEVIPVYDNKLFHLQKHIKRLQNSLDLISIKNPYTLKKWQEILLKLINFNNSPNQSIYLQVTRGADTKRSYIFENLESNIYIESNPLIVKNKQDLQKGFYAITDNDIRWNKCNIKSTSLLASVLYAQKAKKNKVEEVILHKKNIITEGASSNIFMLKNNTLFTHPANNHILAGVTRDLVLEIAKKYNMKIIEKAFSIDEAYLADGLWISSSTREIMPIIKLNNKMINNGKIDKNWTYVHEEYQKLKNYG